MFSVWPFSDATTAWERVSDILMVPSVEPAARKLPASLRARAYTLPVWPSHALASYNPDCSQGANAVTDRAIYAFEAVQHEAAEMQLVIHNDIQECQFHKYRAAYDHEGVTTSIWGSHQAGFGCDDDWTAPAHECGCLFVCPTRRLLP